MREMPPLEVQGASSCLSPRWRRILAPESRATVWQYIHRGNQQKGMRHRRQPRQRRLRSEHQPSVRGNFFRMDHRRTDLITQLVCFCILMNSIPSATRIRARFILRGGQHLVIWNRIERIPDRKARRIPGLDREPLRQNELREFSVHCVLT